MSIFNRYLLVSERPSLFDGITKLKYRYVLTDTVGKYVLDIGCGLGFGANQIAIHNAHQVTGIDYSKITIDWAQNKWQRSNLHFKCLNVKQLNKIHQQYDVIICFEILEHISQTEAKIFIKEIKRILKPEGILFLSTSNKLITSYDSPKPHNPYHLHEYTPHELNSLLASQFKKIQMMGIKTVNKEFLEYQQNMDNSWLGKTVNLVSRYKLTHRILPYFPQNLKNWMLHKPSKITVLKPGDFQIINTKINTCPVLLVKAIKHELK